MNRKTNQEKALEAYQEKQQSIVALLSSIQNKLEKHSGPMVCWGHVGDLGQVEELLNQIDTFLN
jgi:hypothetical protein